MILWIVTVKGERKREEVEKTETGHADRTKPRGHQEAPFDPLLI